MGSELITAAAFGFMYFSFCGVVTAFGAYVYRGRTAPSKLARYPVKFWLYAALPAGLGFILIGIAACAALGTDRFLHLDAVWDILGAIGFALIVAGMLTIYVHPDWIRPQWLKGPIGD